MKIIARYTGANIRSNRSRIPLIILCIAVAVIMFGCSISMPQIVKNYANNAVRSVYGNSDIHISDSVDNNNQITSRYFIPDDVIQASEYIVSIFALNGTMSFNNHIETANVFGVDYEDVKKFNEPTIIEGVAENLSPNQIVISKRYADSSGLTIGSRCKFSFAGKVYNFKVAAIAEDSGIYQWKSMNNIIVSKSTISEIISSYIPVNGMFNICLIKLYDNSDENRALIIEKLQKAYPDWSVSLTTDQYRYNLIVKQNTGPLIVSTSLVVLYCLFIIILTMALVFETRSRQFATMKCMGASFGFHLRSVIYESLIYGIFGGALGTLILRGMVEILTTMPSRYLFDNLGIWYYVSVFVFGLVFSTFASIIPAVKTLKKSIRQTMLPKTTSKKATIVSQATAASVLFIALIVEVLQPLGKVEWLSFILFFTITICCLILIPYVLRYILMLARKIIGINRFSIIYTKNSFANANLKVVSRILLFSIFLIIFLSVSSSTIKEQGDSRANIDYYTVTVENIFDGQGTSVESSLKNNKDIEKTYRVTYYKNCEMSFGKKEVKLNELRGYSLRDIESIYGEYITSAKDETLERMTSNTNYILLNDMYRYVHDLNVGDEIILSIPKGPKHITTNLVVGGFISMNEGDGYCGVMNLSNINTITDIEGFNALYIKIAESEANELIDSLQSNFASRYSITKFFESRRMIIEAFEMPSMIFLWYTVIIIIMSVLFAVVGLYLALRQNMSSHKTMNLLGMGRKQFVLTNMYQLLYVCTMCTGAAIGVVLFSVKQLQNMFMTFGIYFTVKVDWPNLILSIFATIATIIVVCTITTLVHSRQFKLHDRNADE